MPDQDKSTELVSLVTDAINNKRKLNIVGGNSKSFYGRKTEGEPVHVTGHTGVLNYEPSELVITARAGTALSDIESLLAKEGQRLIFEPPYFSETATLGGTIATGINGPCRPWTGSARDSVLGVKIINGRGEILSFGGEVMKNVAGYDVSRLMVGSMGTLGILLDVSLRLLPLPEKTTTLIIERIDEEVINYFTKLNSQFLPLSAMAYLENRLYVRLSGNAASVDAAKKLIGGNTFDESDFWTSIREQSHDFFKQAGTLWRVSVPPATALMKELPGSWLIDWGGAQRWFISDMKAEELRSIVKKANGHATIYRNKNKISDVFHPLTEAQEHLHRMVKQAFDPDGIFNSGRLYANF